MKDFCIDISNSKLFFCIDKNDWCKVSLVDDSDRIKLGAENWPILKEKLESSFVNLSSSKEPEWMLNLSENHCSLYRQTIEGKNIFFGENDQGDLIWRATPITPFEISN